MNTPPSGTRADPPGLLLTSQHASAGELGKSAGSGRLISKIGPQNTVDARFAPVKSKKNGTLQFTNGESD